MSDRARLLDQLIENARADLRELLDQRARSDAARGVYRCAVCKENFVVPENGEDTCTACLSRL